MALFGKKRKQDAATSAAGPPAAEEHAVILHYKLSDDEYGSEDERESIYELEERLGESIEAARAGEFDGNEFGGGEAVLYMYGPDKDQLWRAVESAAREFPLRPAYALLRAGGPDTSPEQVHL